jgi:hypothetical protein
LWRGGLETVDHGVEAYEIADRGVGMNESVDRGVQAHEVVDRGVHAHENVYPDMRMRSPTVTGRTWL